MYWCNAVYNACPVTRPSCQSIFTRQMGGWEETLVHDKTFPHILLIRAYLIDSSHPKQRNFGFWVATPVRKSASFSIIVAFVSLCESIFFPQIILAYVSILMRFFICFGFTLMICTTEGRKACIGVMLIYNAFLAESLSCNSYFWGKWAVGTNLLCSCPNNHFPHISPWHYWFLFETMDWMVKLNIPDLATHVLLYIFLSKFWCLEEIKLALTSIAHSL